MAKGVLLGIDLLNKRLANLSDAVKNGVKQDIQASGQTIRNGAIARVPVDLGGLKGSISAANLNNGTEVVAQQNYAAYVEFGTGAKVKVPPGLEKYAREFFVSGKGTLPARPYMFPAYFEEEPKLIKKIEDRISKA